MKKDELTPIWKALADPTRRHILDLLRQHSRTTGQLCDVFEDLSRYAVMKHLNVLEEAGLILIRRRGRERYNYLNAVPIQQIYERWIHPYEAEWAQSLIHLKNISEETIMSAPTAIQNASTKQIEQEIIVNSSLEKTYQSLLDVNKWWAHRMSRLPDSLRLEAKVGGRFWETRDGSEDNGALWGIVTSIEPNDHIQLSGSIGIQGAVLGNVVICTIPQDDGTTKVTLSHHIIGDIPEGTLDGYDKGWAYHLEMIKKLSETGEGITPPDESE